MTTLELWIMLIVICAVIATFLAATAIVAKILILAWEYYYDQVIEDMYPDMLPWADKEEP